MRNWTVQQVRESAFAKDRLTEPYGVRMGRDEYGPEVVVLTLEQVLDAAEEAHLEAPPAERDLDIPKHVSYWMGQLDIASTYHLEEATLRLTPSQRLEMLSRWFNGGGGLPRAPMDWGKPNGPRKLGFRLDLGHPSLLNYFVRWVIDYLALHKSVDGRVGMDQEALINEARRLKDQPPVTRWP